jgi:hypothetical protein
MVIFRLQGAPAVTDFSIVPGDGVDALREIVVAPALSTADSNIRLFGGQKP